MLEQKCCVQFTLTDDVDAGVVLPKLSEHLGSVMSAPGDGEAVFAGYGAAVHQFTPFALLGIEDGLSRSGTDEGIVVEDLALTYILDHDAVLSPGGTVAYLVRIEYVQDYQEERELDGTELEDVVVQQSVEIGYHHRFENEVDQRRSHLNDAGPHERVPAEGETHLNRHSGNEHQQTETGEDKINDGEQIVQGGQYGEARGNTVDEILIVCQKAEQTDGELEDHGAADIVAIGIEYYHQSLTDDDDRCHHHENGKLFAGFVGIIDKGQYTVQNHGDSEKDHHDIGDMEIQLRHEAVIHTV